MINTNPLIELKNKHLNQDIYVIGSGASLGYIDSEFFENKIVICINNTINHIPTAKVMYLVAKEPNENVQKVAVKKQATIVMCKHHSGLNKNPLNKILFPDKTFIFNPAVDVIKNKDNTESLERSSSTIVTGLHLAAFIGAKNIILIAHDCGSLNGQMHITGYDKSNAVMKGKAYTHWMATQSIEKKTLMAKANLKQFWNVNVYSLNPFINYGLEGNVYKKFTLGDR